MAAWPTPSDAGLLLVLGVACTGVAHTLFIASMQRVSAHTASVVAALEPVYGIALAVALLHEIPARGRCSAARSSSPPLMRRAASLSLPRDGIGIVGLGGWRTGAAPRMTRRKDEGPRCCADA